MKAIKKFTWEIRLSGSPLLKRKCNKCNHLYFYNSGKFRLNSQKKNMDIWLIYKCEKCDNTNNINIFSRIKPDSINKQLYQNFIDNDKATAYMIALDPNIIHKNHMNLDFSTWDYDVLREEFSLMEILQAEAEEIQFIIKCGSQAELKLSHVVRKCLDISSTQLERMNHNGVITISSAQPLKKCKTKEGIVISVHKEKLMEYFDRK